VKLDDGGNIVQEFDSITAILLENPAYSSAGICLCLRNDAMKYKAYGFHWAYKNDDHSNEVYVPLDGEIFKDVKDISYLNTKNNEVEMLNFPNYAVSQYGNVVNNKTKRKIGFYDADMLIINMVGNKKTKSIKAHTLVATIFLDKPNVEPGTKLFVKFKDGNTKNCRVDNLEWITQQDRAIEINGKQMVMTDKDGVETIFNSISKCVEFIHANTAIKGNHVGSGIRACLCGYQETAFGYKWKALDN
jgi:hypothetical protein